MSKPVKASVIRTNLIMSIAAQVVSLAISFILGFVVPKFISETNYSLWQVFLLYIGYVGVLHFGLLDGIVLRYSQYDYEELDKARIRSQFLVLNIFLTVSALIAAILGYVLAEGNYKLIFIFVSAGIITKNIYTYSSYLLQTTNRIKFYSMLVIAQRLCYGIVVVVLLALKVDNFIYYCLADLIGDVIAIIISIFVSKECFYGKTITIAETIKEAKENIKSGIMLLLSNWSAILIVSLAKMMVQWRWDQLVFGKVSFAFSVSNVFLTFVTAISVVLFPSLKRMETDKLPALFFKIRNVISPLLFVTLLLYYPGYLILVRWLPNYSESLSFLGILLPIIVFTTKVSLLTNNYLKAFRKEKTMLLINVASVVLALIGYLLGTYVLNSLEFVLAMAVAVSFVRSVVSEVTVMRLIGKVHYLDFAIDAIIATLFIIFVRYFHFYIGLALYCACLALYGSFYFFLIHKSKRKEL